jgi:hypothetical protein
MENHEKLFLTNFAWFLLIVITRVCRDNNHSLKIIVMHDMKELTNILIEQLEKKGVEPSISHGFIRDLANAILVNPHMNLLQVNERLHLLGWDSFELDYHTLQLAIACFEAEGLKSLENKPARWFENNFKPHKAGVNG